MPLNITQISKDKKIQDAFTDIIQSIISNYAPQKIVLFGSYARGEAHELSLEPLVYSPLELETMKKEKRDFIMTIEEEGIEIYDARRRKMA